MLAQRQRGAYGAALRDYADGAAYPDHLNVRSVGRIERVALADVFWINAAGNYVALHTAAREVLHRAPLGRLEALLRPTQFVRVHRSAIVRRDQVAALSADGDGSYTVSLHCGAQVPVSERHVADVRALLGA
jgi:two-component system LytT family response regulator